MKTWHFRHDWLFTPFVVVVGGKYFLPVPECLLLDQGLPTQGGRQAMVRFMAVLYAAATSGRGEGRMVFCCA